MAQTQNSQDIQNKKQNIDRILSDFQTKMAALQVEQNMLISKFLRELENKKMEEIRKKM